MELSKHVIKRIGARRSPLDKIEWAICKDVVRFLATSDNCGLLSGRKLRLVMVACCRQVWELMGESSNRELVEVGERFADGLASILELQAAERHYLSRHRLSWAPISSPLFSLQWMESSVLGAPEELWKATFGLNLVGAGNHMHFALKMANPPFREAIQDESEVASREAIMIAHVRDIFGPLPYQKVEIDQRWLAWHEGTVLKIANSIYDHRKWEHLPILADALEEAGCVCPEILDHCRKVEHHTRGCWPLDLLLAKS